MGDKRIVPVAYVTRFQGKVYEHHGWTAESEGALVDDTLNIVGEGDWTEGREAAVAKAYAKIDARRASLRKQLARLDSLVVEVIHHPESDVPYPKGNIIITRTKVARKAVQ